MKLSMTRNYGAIINKCIYVRTYNISLLVADVYERVSIPEGNKINATC